MTSSTRHPRSPQRYLETSSILGDFFDSADTSDLNGAVEWTREAILAAGKAAIKANRSLLDIRDAISDETGGYRDASDERPWQLGYAMARRLRGELAVPDTDFFDMAPWVGTQHQGL